MAAVLHTHVLSRQLSEERAQGALSDLTELPLRRVLHRPLLDRIWELRANVTAYDAAYVAVAEAFGVPLVTADARLSRASGIRCRVEVIAAS